MNPMKHMKNPTNHDLTEWFCETVRINDFLPTVIDINRHCFVDESVFILFLIVLLILFLILSNKRIAITRFSNPITKILSRSHAFSTQSQKLELRLTNTLKSIRDRTRSQNGRS
jgi:hypothetical protein